MPNVRLVSQLVFLFIVLSSCSGVGEGSRYPANSGANCFEIGREILENFQSEVGLSEGVKFSIPGQATYGKPRVEYLRWRFQTWEFDEIQDYLNSKIIPYIEDPSGKWILHDRHHLFIALFKEKENLKQRFPKKELRLTYQRKNSFKGKSWQEFRNYLEKNDLVLLRHKGEPISWEQLPKSFGKMDKDFFRGMAWILIKAGIVEKENKPFFEFIWADELRRRFPKLQTKWRLENIEEVFEDIVDNPQDYRHLPGLVEDGPDVDEAFENIEKIIEALNW